MTDSTPPSSPPTVTRILFLCMGNICRSPAAHCVFQHLVDERGLGEHYEIDSAGTIGYHTGAAPDARMQAVLRQAGIPVIGRSRPLDAEDFFTFDYILCMDRENYADARRLQRPQARARLQLFGDYVDNPAIEEIPDPYYGAEGFQRVLEMVTNGCTRLLDALEAERQAKA